MSNNINICHRCEFRKKDCNGLGPCLCTADASNRGFAEIAHNGDCPKGYFIEPGSLPKYDPNQALSTPVPAPPQPVPRAEWPAWAKGLALLSKAEDAGIGDTVHRVIGDFASEKFSLWHKLIFGTPCQCAARQAQWNQQYPLK